MIRVTRTARSLYVPHERWEGVGKVFGICTNIFKNSFPLGDSLFFFIFNFTEVIDDEKNCILW